MSSPTLEAARISFLTPVVQAGRQFGGDAQRCHTRRVDPDDRSARIIAANAGFEIVEVEGRVWFFDRRTRGPGIAAAVSGGVAGITLINAFVMALGALSGANLGGSWWGALALGGVAALAGGVCRAALALRQRRLGCKRADLRPIAMVDRAGGTVLDARGTAIAPVAQVRAGRGMLIGSSAPALFLRPPGGGRIEVFRGSLFGGGIERAQVALAKLGFSR
ncbi:hypothetical protein DB30_06793 [Enhygromyxa salina]|uniref:Uncharacterized protein n=1 Tax=Enhygromyxa salina TaxID=215803 RepID=A0A0C2CXT1_9BACT|nr:hypothetical protein [Enhygromyxa salina]KIG14450.1 hypothetical protein DB30_06793 [Enhygromyxa salina]